MSWTRLGFLVPSGNSTLERDTRIGLPDTVSAHFARMAMTKDDPEQVAGLHEAAPRAAELLAHADVDVIAFACTTGSLYEGQGFDERIAERITAATGIRATTTSTAVVQALRSLGMSRVVLVTPYEPWLDELVVRFLGTHDIAVTRVAGPGLPYARDIVSVPPERIADEALADQKALEEADGVFLSCTAFRGLEAAAQVRARAGVPVVSSNEATFWAALREVGLASDTFPAGGHEEMR